MSMTIAAILTAQAAFSDVALGQATCAAPASGAPVAQSVSSVPLVAEMSNQTSALEGYAVPVQLSVSIHKFFFTFHMHRQGQVRYRRPDKLAFDISGIPQKYTNVFSLLGTPRTWPTMYNLTLLGSDIKDGQRVYHLRGVPVRRSDVDYVLIDTTDACAPIHATWVLRSGWTLDSTIDTGTLAGGIIVPRTETTEITGHGYQIHTTMTYGKYALARSARRQTGQASESAWYIDGVRYSG
jgi:hypothetical protein